MKKKQILLCEYSQHGHYMYPEDTWKDIVEIKGVKSLISACKDWQKISASNFNDYPIGGLFSFDKLKFFKQDVIIDDGGTVFFYGTKSECERPVYFLEAKQAFEEWKSKLKRGDGI